MAFRQLQRFGKLSTHLIANDSSVIVDIFGPCIRGSQAKSVIFQRPVLPWLQTRCLSSFSTLSSPNRRTHLSCFNNSNHEHLLSALNSPNLNRNLNPFLNPALSFTSRHFSIGQKDVEKSDGEKPEKKSLIQRFKDTYKEYGKVLVGVHLATSAVWLGSFYYLAYTGIDIVPLLEKLGFGEKVVGALGKPGVGHIAVAYLLYKLATPARYTVTIVGTQMTVKQLRNLGYLQPIKKEDSLRSLFKEGRSQVKERYGDMKEEMQSRMVTRREKFRRDFVMQRERFRTRQTKLRNDLERRAKLRTRNIRNGRNGSNGQSKMKQ